MRGWGVSCPNLSYPHRNCRNAHISQKNAISPCFGSNSGRSNRWTKNSTNEPQSAPVYKNPISWRPVAISSARLDGSESIARASKRVRAPKHLRILRQVAGPQDVPDLSRRISCARALCCCAERLMRTRSRGATRDWDCMLTGLHGMGLLSERFTANGTAGEDCGEGAVAAETGRAIGELWSSHVSREVGMGAQGSLRG